MNRKILVAGMILFFSFACLPHWNSLSEKTSPDPLPVKQESSFFEEQKKEEFSGLRQPESEDIFSPPSDPPQQEAFPASPTPSFQEQTAKAVEFPISDESNDDFNLEILPGDRPLKGLDFDIPIVINEKVEHFIQYFQTTAKNRFSSWLARSEKYIPFMRNLLKENGLPEDLVYMALIESGFNPYAYSRSKASGPWQFIYLTGKRYGLRSNWWIDERRDPEKSTIAAAKYLKDLYDMFECWYLAAAGYNAGEKKIAAAMQRYQTEDFWELTKYRYLKQETKDYVPQMIAAALIAKDPEKYGFVGIEYEEPLRYEKVKVPDVTDLRLIARACETTVDEIKELNPELSRWCTPPDFPDYEIKIPFGKKELFLKNFGILQSGVKFQFKTHVVKKGESLPKIARLYRIDLEPILEINRLKKKSRLTAGTNLLIPLPKDQDSKTIHLAKKESRRGNQGSKPVETTYMIKKGDSLWSIANEMGVNIGALGRWNQLHTDKLMPGDKLKIRIAETSRPSKESRGKQEGREIVYVVKKGDTLWSIARKFNLTVSEIKTLNHLGKGDRIQPEDRLKLRVGGTKSSTPN
jgi:membrane-bound lytic murein transglycosylase D